MTTQVAVRVYYSEFDFIPPFYVNFQSDYLISDLIVQQMIEKALYAELFKKGIKTSDYKVEISTASVAFQPSITPNSRLSDVIDSNGFIVVQLKHSADQQLFFNSCFSKAEVSNKVAAESLQRTAALKSELQRLHAEKQEIIQHITSKTSTLEEKMESILICLQNGGKMPEQNLVSLVEDVKSELREFKAWTFLVK